VPKVGSIRSSVSIELQLVTDRQTDRQTRTQSIGYNTAMLAQRSARENDSRERSGHSSGP